MINKVKLGAAISAALCFVRVLLHKHLLKTVTEVH